MDTEQMNTEQGANGNLMRGNNKIIWTVAAIMAGVALLGAGAYLAWNSRQARILRATKRAASVMYKTGMVLQSVAEATK